MIKNLPIQYIEGLTDEELWQFFAYLKSVLRTKKLVRTGNIVGDRGEFIAINFYNKLASLPKLQIAPEGTQNVDALSRKGERYSIKTITEPGVTTGVFHGICDKEELAIPEKKFEYLIIVQIDSEYLPKRVIELTWLQFLKFKKWHKTMSAWNISVTQELLKEAKIIFSKQSS